jgi:hypothetical protein
MMRDQFLIGFLAILVMTTACGPTSPTPPVVNLSATWIMDNPTGVTGQTTVWVLTQSGSHVTGTSTRTADIFVADTGTISGDVSGSSFTFQWEKTTDYGGVGACRMVKTVSTGTLTVAGSLMAGTISSLPQPPCNSRASVAEYSFRRQ